MDFLRALKFAAVIGLVVAAVWLIREDRLCKAEIDRRLGPVVLVEHSFGSTDYEVVPQTWREAWHRGMPFPVVVTCWTGFSGVTSFAKH